MPTLADRLRGAHAPGLPVASSPLPSPRPPSLRVPHFPDVKLFRTTPEPEQDPRKDPPALAAKMVDLAPVPVPNPLPTPSADSSPPSEEPHSGADSIPASPTDPVESMAETIAALLGNDLPSSRALDQQENPGPVSNGAGSPEATDADLASAFQPLIEASVQKGLYGSDLSLHSYLEPMLRNTVRRAIAEQMECSRQFKQISSANKIWYRLSALLRSRTYDDIVFERTHRYQVEEAYLLRRADNGLISYAHHDPGCHVSERRVIDRVRELTSKLQAPHGGIESSFDLSKHRLGLVREGQWTLLVGVVRGRSNALVRADLDYVQRQAESKFGARLETRTDAFIRVLQPILEGCLLIQSPAPPH